MAGLKSNGTTRKIKLLGAVTNIAPLQEITITPSADAQEHTPAAGYAGFSVVRVEGIPSQPGTGGYIIGTPVNFTIAADSWDGTHCDIKANGYKIGANGLQIGLPASDTVLNTKAVVEAALTIPSCYTTSPNQDKNTAGYVTITVSAITAPDTDITIAIFGLEEAEQVMVTQTAIEGVPIPATGVHRGSISNIENTQFFASIVFAPNDYTFKASTKYTATITLTAKPGYKFAGVAANSFTVEGASSVTNSAGSGVVTAVFPTTAAS